MQNKRAIGYVRKQEQLLKKFEDTEQFFETVRQNKSFKRNNNINSLRNTLRCKNQRYVPTTLKIT